MTTAAVVNLVGQAEEAKMFRSNNAALVRRFLHDDRAATAVEYALLAAGIAGTIIGVVWNLGADVKQQLYDKVAALFG